MKRIVQRDGFRRDAVVGILTPETTTDRKHAPSAPRVKTEKKHMRDESRWQPVVPSHFLRVSDNIAAGFLDGEELALWRSPDGAAQAWENRCPHRGTRLTLGRIMGERLSCAYHGWEFTANGGRCTAIPAQPSVPAPKNLTVKTFAVREAAGMVWVCKDPQESAAEASLLPSQQLHFCRSLGIKASESKVADELSELGFSRSAPLVWTGAFGTEESTVFLNAGGPSLSFAHVWLKTVPNRAQVRKINAVLVRLRQGAEQSTVSRSQA